MTDTQTPAVTLTLRITPDDFEQLTQSSANQATGGLDRWDDRYLDMTTREFLTIPEIREWRYAYWLEDYTHVILARSFLKAIGERYRLVADEYMEEPEKAHGVIHHTHSAHWVIFTGYASPVWAKEQQR